MANNVENASDIDAKLKLLADLITDLMDKSPSNLRKILNHYRVFLEGVDVLPISPLIDAACQTETETAIEIESAWNIDSIKEDVTCIAKKVTLETGFSYDENSGWYYDHKMKCYYNSNLRLYYYNEHKAYYYYDEESKALKFYCFLTDQVDNSLTIGTSNQNITVEVDKKEDVNSEKEQNGEVFSQETTNIENKNLSEDKEEGECSDSDGGNNVDLDSNIHPAVIEAKPTVFEPGNTKHFAPCIRVIVKSSGLPTLCNGTLFIVTCTGGTIGREGDHDVLIPDHLVSKVHSKFQYVLKGGNYLYELIDLGSKNGTFVNGKRLSDTLVQSDPTTITHGSIITVGHTDLLCHIHPYDETCSDCAPFDSISQGKCHTRGSDVSLKKQYNFEASIIKKKFGIGSSFIPKLPEGYEDRAEIRRKLVGSSHCSEKTETASINEPICKKNKGYKLLSKMGWKEGNSLGKRNEGVSEPVFMGDGNNEKLGLGFESNQ